MNKCDESLETIRRHSSSSSTPPVSTMPCPHCRRISASPTIMPCEHAYCSACINQLSGAENGRPVCSACLSTFILLETPGPGCQPRIEEPCIFFRSNYLPAIEATGDPGEIMTDTCNSEVIPSGVKVMGMYFWNHQLYVVFHRKPAIYVYNIQSTVPFRVRQTIHPIDLHWPRGIAVDGGTGCSYVIDWTHMFSGTLWKMSLIGVAEKIADIEVQPFGISLSDNGNAIIVTCSTPVRAFLPAVKNSSKIIIFTPSGTIRETINLSNDLEIPRHALRVDGGTSSEYFVIHGWGHKRGQVVCVKSIPRDEHASLLKSDGQIQHGCYGSTQAADQNLDKPLSLFDDGNDGILVVDYANNRIHLMNYNMRFIQHIVTEVNAPRHVCLDSYTGVLFVGLESGEIRAFQVQAQSSLNNVD